MMLHYLVAEKEGVRESRKVIIKWEENVVFTIDCCNSCAI